MNKVIFQNGKIVRLQDTTSKKCFTIDTKQDNTLLYILIALGVLILMKD